MNSFYSFSVNTYKEIIISLYSLYAQDLGGTSVEDMKTPKEDYEIHKSVVSDLGTREDLLNFLSFYLLLFLTCNYI